MKAILGIVVSWAIAALGVWGLLAFAAFLAGMLPVSDWTPFVRVCIYLIVMLTFGALPLSIGIYGTAFSIAKWGE